MAVLVVVEQTGSEAATLGVEVWGFLLVTVLTFLFFTLSDKDWITGDVYFFLGLSPNEILKLAFILLLNNSS